MNGHSVDGWEVVAAAADEDGEGRLIRFRIVFGREGEARGAEPLAASHDSTLVGVANLCPPLDERIPAEHRHSFIGIPYSITDGGLLFPATRREDSYMPPSLRGDAPDEKTAKCPPL